MAVWRLIAHHADADTQIQAFRDLGCIAIGWSGVGDLRHHGPASAAEITPQVREAYPEEHNAHLGGPSLWRFYDEMRPGDLVILSDGSRRRAVMRVAGGYEFTPEGEAHQTHGYRHRRAAEPVASDPEVLWADCGGFAPGENTRWTLARCMEDHLAPQAAAIVGVSDALIRSSAGGGHSLADTSADDGWPTHCVTRDGRRFARIAYGDEPDDWGGGPPPVP